ncbi:transglutaminase-like domain-containing protein [Anaerocolumna xylanovorans]|uniref:Transglutaminase-like superfamily protein n=1 Tax=Anaerocolumna xylanovorans DSM 12503 TaxID=1121345 RepID=A0A1M7Y4Z4_9FIRM|nr:transglutaminase-like domain-containing protein [Anaerocolumna xylanovorans]SHO47388.1 hypothetical protein SAMN02745217_01519 [Anaerocolumna xylanovorans DSM 12503]
MKKKLAISTFVIIFLISVVTYVLQDQKYRAAIKPAEIADIPVTGQLLETQFYYQQLTEEEKKIYEEIKELLNQHKGGEIVLEQPINAKSYFHIESSLRYDGISYWYLAYLFPFSSDNTHVIPANEQYSEEKKIDKILLIIDSDKFQREMPVISEEDVTNSKEESTDIYQNMKDAIDYLMDNEDSYYDGINEKIEKNLQQIIDDMSKGLNQEEAVQYFSQWLVDHMVYDPAIAKYIMTGDLVGYDFRKQISAGSITSINDRIGTCTGFSLILTNLCNRVGMEAYVVLGDTPGGRHGWAAIKIGDETYYKDPTSEIENQKVKPLQTEVQFYQYFHKTYKPFSDLFQY